MKKKRKIPVSKIFVYFILAGMGFVYLYPVLYMIVNSFLSAGDLTDPSVTWIPNYVLIILGLHLKHWIFLKVLECLC